MVSCKGKHDTRRISFRERAMCGSQQTVMRAVSLLRQRRCSHVGRRPVKFGKDVCVDLLPMEPPPNFPTCRRKVVVSGPKGKLEFPLHPGVEVQTKLYSDRPSNVLHVSVGNPADGKQRSRWGLTRTHIANMVEGVTEGWDVTLRLNGVGYRAMLEDGKISLKLGYAHPIVVNIPDGVSVSIPSPTFILLQGIDLQKVTQFAASIRRWRPPEPYNLKGVFVNDETIKKKEGKKR